MARLAGDNPLMIPDKGRFFRRGAIHRIQSFVIPAEAGIQGHVQRPDSDATPPSPHGGEGAGG